MSYLRFRHDPPKKTAVLGGHCLFQIQLDVTDFDNHLGTEETMGDIIRTE